MQYTSFEIVYDCFFSKITDDMYMELDENQTHILLEELLLNSIPSFEFPKVNLNDYNLKKKTFNILVSDEEINILATYMVIGWFDQQLASIEQTRMKYSGSDFKFTSQANHMAKLLQLKKDYERVGFHLQRLYKRRKMDSNGVYRSTFASIMSTSVRDGKISNPLTSTNQLSGYNRTLSAPEKPDNWEDIDKDFSNSTDTSDEGDWEEMHPVTNVGENNLSWDDM